MKKNIFRAALILILVFGLCYSAATLARTIIIEGNWIQQPEPLGDEKQLGATVLQVYQGGTGAQTFSSGQCLIGNGSGAITTQSCGGAGGGSSIWSTTSPPVVYYFNDGDPIVIGDNATSTPSSLFEVNGLMQADSASITSLVAGNTGISGTLNVTSKATLANASTTQLTVSDNLWFTDLTSCDTIDTDANGLLSCGTDSGGGGSNYGAANAIAYYESAGTTATGTVGLYFNETTDVLTVVGASTTNITATNLYPTNINSYFGSDCSAGDYVKGVDANGTLDCSTPATGSNNWGDAGALAFYSSAGTTATGTDITELYWDDTNNRLGIGTSTPDYPLQMYSEDDIDFALSNASSSDRFRNIIISNDGSFSVDAVNEDGSITTNLMRLYSDYGSGNEGVSSGEHNLHHNTFIGYEAGKYLMATATPENDYTNNFWITAVGYQALASQNAVENLGQFSECTVYGAGAASYTDTGCSQSVAIGGEAAFGKAQLTKDTFIGNDVASIGCNGTGGGNVAVGNAALNNNCQSSALGVNWGKNTAIGWNAMFGTNNSSAYFTTAIGADTAEDLETGYRNIFLGFKAGNNLEVGNNNIIIGSNIDFPATSTSDMIDIANLIYGKDLTNFWTGNPGGQDQPISNVNTGKIGIGSSSPYAKLSVVASSTETTVPLLVLANSSGAIMHTVAHTGTTTSANGFDITSGCYAINGTCINTSGGSGEWTDDGLLIYPTETGDVVVIGASATTSPGVTAANDVDLEVDGDVYIKGDQFVLTEYITHAGDEDTYMDFTSDSLKFVIGNLGMLDIVEGGTDYVAINENGADIDFRVEGDTDTHALFVQGSNNKVGISTSTPSYTLTVDGTLMFSGQVYDNNYSAGSAGQVLMNTGTGVKWAATSTASGSSEWTDDGLLIYPNETGDVVVIGNNATSSSGVSAAPNPLLEVVGDLYVKGSHFVLGDSNGDFISHYNDDDTYFGFNGTDNLYYVVGNLNMLTLSEGATDFAVFNELSADIDFRIESDSDTHAFYMDGATGKIGLGTSTPEEGALLNILDTTEQLRLNFDANDYASFTINTDGDLTISSSQAATATTTIQSKAFVIDVGSYNFEFYDNNGTGTIRYISE